MWGALKEFLSGDGTRWHETLPFLVGFGFVCIEIAVRIARQRRPILDVPVLAYMLGEGIFVTIALIYGLALVFSKPLALEVAEKNSKVLAGAMFVAFATLVVHIFNRWFTKSADNDQ